MHYFQTALPALLPKFPRTQVGPTGATSPTEVVSHLRQNNGLVDGFGGLVGQLQISRGRVDKIAIQPAGPIVAKLRLAALETNLSVHQIVHDFGVRGSRSNTNAPAPVPFRAPDG